MKLGEKVTFTSLAGVSLCGHVPVQSAVCVPGGFGTELEQKWPRSCLSQGVLAAGSLVGG